MAISYEVIQPGSIAIVIGLVLLFLIAPKLAGRAKTLRTKRIRIATGIALAVLVAGAIGLNTLGAPLDPASRPLRTGHAYGGDDPRLLAMRDLPRSGTNPLLSEYDYAYSPGAEIRIAFTLANAGSAPLTVVAIESPPSLNVRSVEFRLPSAVNSGLPATYANQYPGQPPGALADRQFHSFEIPAQGEVGLATAVTMGECPGSSPVPTLAPGASLLPSADPSLAGGFDVFNVIDVRYVQFGIARTETIVLPFSMHAVTGETNVYGCPPA